MAQLIPGLPDDLARQCLIRIPYELFPVAASVCKNWRKELQSSLFHHLRKAAGLSKQFIALILSKRLIVIPTNANGPSYCLVLFDPAASTWGKLLPFPYPNLHLPHCFKLVAVGCKLVAIGGEDPKTSIESYRVHVYDFATGAWRQGARKPGHRCSEGIEEETLEAAETKSCLEAGDEETCVVFLPEWEVAMVPSDGDAGREWRRIGVAPQEVREHLQVVACGRSVLLLGAQTYGGRRVGYVADVVAQKGETVTWRDMKLPMECYVLGSCWIEI